jgi:hypothetical protein
MLILFLEDISPILLAGSISCIFQALSMFCFELVFRITSLALCECCSLSMAEVSPAFVEVMSIDDEAMLVLNLLKYCSISLFVIPCGRLCKRTQLELEAGSIC